jgi:hypothetical protein
MSGHARNGGGGLSGVGRGRPCGGGSCREAGELGQPGGRRLLLLTSKLLLLKKGVRWELGRLLLERLLKRRLRNVGQSQGCLCRRQTGIRPPHSVAAGFFDGLLSRILWLFKGCTNCLKSTRKEKTDVAWNNG